jgi:L-ascorbate metabolism protein UlaG (beta-lactamase superfamily)
MSLRVTYFGHATTLVEAAGTRIVTDPILRRAILGGFIRRAGAAPRLDRPDAVLLSHQHADHLDLPSLRRLGRETPVIAPRGSGGRIGRGGMTNVREVEAGETARIGDAVVTATPALHDGRRLPIGRPVDALGYTISSPAGRVYFAGDTDLFDEMADLAGVDVALLPIGGWGGNEMGEGHLDPERAARAAALIRPRVVVPIHWGTLLRADLQRRRPALHEPPPAELRRHLAEHAPDVELRILEPGDLLEIG